MESARSLQHRAVLALLLMVGFYVFAIAIAAALLSVPYFEVMFMERINAQITIFCVGAGITILWAIVPRIDKFTPPGPRLTPSNAPQLFTMINDVAKATSQARPEDVFLLADVNAFVTHRGGMMGIGSRRVMGIGLPLIKGLTPSELRAVIAHEFGHYVSGDVALGPWIYKTRGAIGRTLMALGEDHMLINAFNWYARMFMRMTTQISREQEFVADATAARVAGTAPAISALKRVEVIAPAFSTYMSQEVIPIVGHGYLPPVVEGFDQYMNDPDLQRMFQEYAKQVALGEVGLYDTHPPMTERIAALEGSKLPASELKADSAPELLKDPERHARAVIEHALGNQQDLQGIAWSDVGAKVYTKIWESTTKQNARWLRHLTADTIPAEKFAFIRKAREIPIQYEEAPDDYRISIATHILSCAIGTALLRKGWTFETAPGKPVVVVKDGVRFVPRDSIAKLADGTLPVEEWKATCESLGLAGLPLNPEP